MPPSSACRLLTPDIVSAARRDEPGKLKRRLSGDLDMIVLKALRKEPERRYASVEQLSEDVRRHLEGWPVVARADSWAYRARKALARNALAATLSCIALVSIMTLAAVSTAQALRLARQRNDLIAAAQRERSMRFDAAVGRREQLEQRLLAAYLRGDNIEALRDSDSAVSLCLEAFGPDDQATANQLYLRSRVLHRLGRFEQARDDLERCLPWYVLHRAAGDIGLAQARFRLGAALLALGRDDEAPAFIRLAVSRGRADSEFNPDQKSAVDATTAGLIGALRACQFDIDASSCMYRRFPSLSGVFDLHRIAISQWASALSDR